METVLVVEDEMVQSALVKKCERGGEGKTDFVADEEY